MHALYKRFARSTEKTGESEGTLFAEAEQVAESDSPQAEAETTTVAEHTRTKRGRKPIDPDLPRVDIVHDIDESQKRCGCGHRLVRIGEEACEKVQVIPEQIWIERHIRPKYACHECEGSADEDRPAVRIAPAVASIIPATMGRWIIEVAKRLKQAANLNRLHEFHEWRWFRVDGLPGPLHWGVKQAVKRLKKVVYIRKWQSCRSGTVVVVKTSTIISCILFHAAPGLQVSVMSGPSLSLNQTQESSCLSRMAVRCTTEVIVTVCLIK